MDELRNYASVFNAIDGVTAWGCRSAMRVVIDYRVAGRRARAEGEREVPIARALLRSGKEKFARGRPSRSPAGLRPAL